MQKFLVYKAFGAKRSRVVHDSYCTSCWCKNLLVHMLLVQEFFGLKGFWCKGVCAIVSSVKTFLV